MRQKLKPFTYGQYEQDTLRVVTSRGALPVPRHCACGATWHAVSIREGRLLFRCANCWLRAYRRETAH